MGRLMTVAEPFAELAIAFEKQLPVSFEFLGSFDRQFRFGLDVGSTPEQSCDHHERRGFESTSQCVV